MQATRAAPLQPVLLTCGSLIRLVQRHPMAIRFTRPRVYNARRVTLVIEARPNAKSEPKRHGTIRPR